MEHEPSSSYFLGCLKSFLYEQQIRDWDLSQLLHYQDLLQQPLITVITWIIIIQTSTHIKHSTAGSKMINSSVIKPVCHAGQVILTSDEIAALISSSSSSVFQLFLAVSHIWAPGRPSSHYQLKILGLDLWKEPGQRNIDHNIDRWIIKSSLSRLQHAWVNHSDKLT